MSKTRALLSGILGIASLASLLSCNDSTGPGGGGSGAGVVEVRVTSTGRPIVGVDQQSGGPSIRCDVNLEASARGSGRIDWKDATFRWYVGASGTEEFDAVTVPATTVAISWGANTIAPGERKTAAWSFGASIPFNATVEYGYLTEDGTDTTTAPVGFSCSPQIPANAGPPTLTGLTFSPASGEVQAGDTLRLSFVADAQAGMWQSQVRIQGPCDTTFNFVEVAAKHVAHPITWVVPPGCALGPVFTAGATMLDANLVEVSGSPANGPVVADHRPPTATAYFMRPGAGFADTVLAGDLFVGDRLELGVVGSDRQGLAEGYLDIPAAGIHDSLPLTGVSADANFVDSIRATWVGTLDFQLRVRDAAGQFSRTIGPASGAIPVYPRETRPAVSRSYGNAEIRTVAIDAPGQRLYLLHGNQHQIEITDLATLASLGTINLPGVAQDMDLVPGEDSLVVSMPGLGALAIVDLTPATPVVTTVALDSLTPALSQSPQALRVGTNRKVFVVLAGSSAAASRLLEYDLGTGAERFHPEAGSGGYVDGELERSEDHAAMVFRAGPGSYQRYDVGGNVFGPVVMLPATTARLRVDATFQRASIGLVLYDGALQQVGQAHTTIGGLYESSTLSPDASELYYWDGARGIIRTRTSDGGVVSVLTSPLPPGYMRFSADGNWLVLVQTDEYFTSAVSVLDFH